jgi:hypothetical protein
LSLYRGDTHHWQFRLWDDSKKTDPTDLTGVTASAEVRSRADGTLMMTLVCSVTVPNIVDVELPAAIWDGWAGGTKGVWDLQLTYGTGRVVTVVGGSVNITADITE